MTHFEWSESIWIDGNGSDESELIVLPSEVVEEWHSLVAVLDCGTWAEVKALGPDVYREVLDLAGHGDYADFIRGFDVAGEAPAMSPPPEALAEYLRLSDEGIPADDEPFEAFNDIPAVADGDWPPNVHLLMANLLPSEVLAHYATIRQTVLNGDFAHIALTDKGAVLQLLEQLGHTHSMDDRVLDLMGDD
jgi:hypothetical protein